MEMNQLQNLDGSWDFKSMKKEAFRLIICNTYFRTFMYLKTDSNFSIGFLQTKNERYSWSGSWRSLITLIFCSLVYAFSSISSNLLWYTFGPFLNSSLLNLAKSLRKKLFYNILPQINVNKVFGPSCWSMLGCPTDGKLLQRLQAVCFWKKKVWFSHFAFVLGTHFFYSSSSVQK